MAHAKNIAPPLPLMAHLMEYLRANRLLKPLSNVAVFYVHHALNTSLNVIQRILELGVAPHNVFVLGKHYSECPSVVKTIEQYGIYCQPSSSEHPVGYFSSAFENAIDRLWRHTLRTIDADIKRIIVIDHGGYALAQLPKHLCEQHQVVGLEKTAGGIMRLKQHGLPNCPVIDVANCAVKKALEPPLIAEAIVKKLSPFFFSKESPVVYGVIGCGSIGKAIIKKLQCMNQSVCIYDSNNKAVFEVEDVARLSNTKRMDNLHDLLAASDCIFGCTGQDTLTGELFFDSVSSNKTLISCSSGDIEFQSVLRKAQFQYNKNHSIADTLDDIHYRTISGGVIHIVNGGFPVNFDHSGESVPPYDIQLTRALVLAGIIQCGQLLDHPAVSPGLYALDTALQCFISNTWLQLPSTRHFPDDVVAPFQLVDWIATHSNGIPLERMHSFPNTEDTPELTK